MRSNRFVFVIFLGTIWIYPSNFKNFVRRLAESQHQQDKSLEQLSFLYDALSTDQKRVIDAKINTDSQHKLLSLYLQAIKLYVPFNRSLAPRSPDYDTLSDEDLHWWDTMRCWYEQHSFAVTKPSVVVKIPKIIHQVWLGPAPFPVDFEDARQSILKHHPDWQYMLWTDADVESFGLVNKSLFDAAKNYGEKSDIFRYEILERYGGVYLDVDVACVKSLEILHYCYGFYTGILFRGTVGLGIGVIGCAPRHPIIKLCIASMKDHGSKTDFQDIMMRSGPIHFTRCYMQLFEKVGDCIALPPSYFYPIPNTSREMTKEENAHWMRPETFTMHYWGCTWQGKKQQ